MTCLMFLRCLHPHDDRLASFFLRFWLGEFIKGSLEETSELRRVEKRCDWKVKSVRCHVN